MNDVEQVVMCFSTEGQRNKYRKIRAFFERLITLKNKGAVILVDGENYGYPYVDGYEIGFLCGNIRIVFVGSSFLYNRETDSYDIPWIDITIKEIRSRIVALQRISI